MYRIKNDVFGYTLRLYVGLEEFSAFKKRADREWKDEYGEVDDDPNALAFTMGNCMYLNIGHPKYALDRTPIKRMAHILSTIVHECSHIVDNMFSYIEAENPDTETRAYALDYYFGEVILRLHRRFGESLGGDGK